MGQRFRAPLLAAHPDPGTRRFGGLHRRMRAQIEDRLSRPDRLAEQSGARRRGAGDARHSGARPPCRRHAARDDQRVFDLRSQPAGGAGAHRRGHGADPQGLDRAAALRLAGPALPVPHRLGLAAPVAATLSADLCARHQPRILRVRRASSYRPRRFLRAL